MSSYFSAAQLRSDAWHRLRSMSEKLERAGDVEERLRLRDEIADVLTGRRIRVRAEKNNASR